MKKILISISPSSGDDYIKAIELVGGKADAYYLPNYLNTLNMDIEAFSNMLSNSYDGLILGGGGDVEPSIFGEENKGSTRIDKVRDEIELCLIKNFMDNCKPIMGICRGFQVMNVALGGTIIQDMTELSREYHTSKDLTFKIHNTYCDKKSFLTELYGKEFKVNSHHHQCIKDIAPNLLAIQYALEDGCIEGMVHTTYPYIGVQWHPERICIGNKKDDDCIDGALVFKYFMKLIEER